MACQILSSPVLVNVPSSDTLAYLLSILTFGILTLSNLKYPLSLALYPNFAPISPTKIPGNGLWVLTSLIWTTKFYTPYLFPSIYTYAYATTWVAVIPISLPHHLVALSDGVLIIKSLVYLSYVAVVSILLTSEPCANSVYE